MLLSRLIGGHTLVVIPRFTYEIFLKAIQDHKIPFLMLVPPQAVFLAKSPLVDQYDISCVTGISVGAAPLMKETEDLLRKRYTYILFVTCLLDFVFFYAYYFTAWFLFSIHWKYIKF